MELQLRAVTSIRNARPQKPYRPAYGLGGRRRSPSVAIGARKIRDIWLVNIRPLQSESDVEPRKMLELIFHNG